MGASPLTRQPLFAARAAKSLAGRAGPLGRTGRRRESRGGRSVYLGVMELVKLSALLGQPEVSAFLRGVVARGRYANAYLFHGPPGIGKGTAALAFARAILCEHGTAA